MRLSLIFLKTMEVGGKVQSKGKGVRIGADADNAGGV